MLRGVLFDLGSTLQEYTHEDWSATTAELNRAVYGFIEAQGPVVSGLTAWVAHLADPEAVGLLGVALAILALARGRPRVAAAVLLLIADTSVSSQLLKAVIDYPRYEALLSVAEVKPAAFPSGHATAAMTLAFCGVLVAPAESSKVSDGVPFTEANVRRLLADEPLASPGACILSRSWRFRSSLLPPT